jgi:hypothetical protein
MIYFPPFYANMRVLFGVSRYFKYKEKKNEKRIDLTKDKYATYVNPKRKRHKNN